MKTFRKAIAIMLALVFMLSLVSVSSMAEVASDGSAIVRLSNPIWVRTDSNNVANAQDYSTYLRAGSAYRAWFQLDFSGYEYLLRDDSSSVTFSLSGPQTSAKIVDLAAYVLNDSADAYAGYYATSGLSWNDVKADLYVPSDKALASMTPFFAKVTSDAVSSYTSDADKQIVIDALDASTDDSIVTFYLHNMGGSSSYTNKGGFTHNNANTYIKITGAENATVDGYVNDIANMITWDAISSESMKNVTAALNLPTKYLGTNITWSSSDENVVNSQTGEVTINPNANTYVTLTANYTYTGHTGETATAQRVFNIRVPRPVFDYSAGVSTYYNGDNNFVNNSGSGATHSPVVAKVGGIAGKLESDLCYELRDANGNRRYDFSKPVHNDITDRDIFEFSVCVPENGYGYYVQMTLYKNSSGDDSSSSSEISFRKDGIYDQRFGDLLYSWDGTKWHNVAMVAPGVVSSNDDGVVYDRTLKIYVDGNLALSIKLDESSYTEPTGAVNVRTNGLCPLEDYTKDQIWDTVACYLDNLRWTTTAYAPEYNTLSNVTSASYEIDDNNLITITNSGVTAADLEADLTIDEDAVIRVYNAAGVLVEDKSQEVADGYTVVVADTNGTTAERSYAYYNIRVIEDGTMEFDASVIESEDGNVNGSVKLYNNTDAAKTYDVYLVVYSEKEAVTVLEPVTLSVYGGSVGTVDTASVAFANGNIAKVLVWEQGTTTPAIKSVQYK